MSPQCRPPADLATFRRVLGSFCSGVTVAARGREGPLGLTCRAFASLSHDPPLILISPSQASITWPKIRRIGRFRISILRRDAAGNGRLDS
jgi:3-hydroxy-9,10-secoandrosta-1,3,5(10)-triene-9,17-dione monooxygenase reductase component